MTVEQLESNLGAVEIELDADELAALAALQEPADEYWTARSKQAWE